MNKTYRIAAALLLCMLAGLAQAQDKGKPPAAAPLPAWEQLTPAQRDELIAPMRERWNRSPEDRQRMYDHAHRWRLMSPEQRREARKGMQRWEQMDPQKREQMRALFERMRGMNPEDRAALKAKWRAMTPEQRKQWFEANSPKKP